MYSMGCLGAAGLPAARRIKNPASKNTATISKVILRLRFIEMSSVCR
jgi:hypothetical protein